MADQPLTADHVAAIARAIVDKATAEGGPLPWVTATVARFEDKASSPFPKVVVNVDGDPPERMAEMHLAGGRPVAEGDRVVVAYVPPQGAWAFPLSADGGTFVCRATDDCGGPPV